ncbi:hypothetical protein [Bradymonas sediminis]|uniref:hypothetical protein n=1 Tax=Bradymonas sediminis TaxID=1548548 RepID=UPI00105E83C4|nr:hypothetical protein [Bradymonas sediminis]TDP77209.1 hypothetical protein DFR33_101106 [Bradymonas sediminis]
MHPLVTRIHPSYRTAFLAWFVTRSVLWIAAALAGVSPMLAAEDFSSFAGGSPGWSLLVHTVGLCGDYAPQVLAGLGELSLLAGCVAVYRFVRRDQLPQTAESATWLWAASPAMIFTIPAGDWTFAIALAAVALMALGESRHILAGITLAAAMWFRPEAILLWPGVAFLGWQYYQPSKHHSMSIWAATLGPLVAFILMVLTAIGMAGRYGVSIRTLQGPSEWRHGFDWQSAPMEMIATHSADLFLLAAIVVCLVMVVGYFRQVPKSWPLLALPCLAWPLLYQPPTAAIAMMLFALPFFGYLARAAADPVAERPLLTASLGALLLMMLSRGVF